MKTYFNFVDYARDTYYSRWSYVREGILEYAEVPQIIEDVYRLNDLNNLEPKDPILWLYLDEEDVENYEDKAALIREVQDVESFGRRCPI